MEKAFIIEKKSDRKVLNKAGGWSRSASSYRLAYFKAEAEALAAIPSGLDCIVKPVKPKEEDIEGTFFILGSNNKMLDKQNIFVANHYEDAYSFSSEKEALDHCESLGLNLDTLDIIKIRKK